MLNTKKLLTKVLTAITPQWKGGLTDYEGGVKFLGITILWGTNTQSVSSASDKDWNTSFGWSYAYKPLVVAQVIETSAPSNFSVVVNSITTSGCTFRRHSVSSTAYSCTILWFAIGKSA